MGRGWLTPWSIRDTDTGKWIIKSDDPLLPQWEFPDTSGKVLLDTTGTASHPDSIKYIAASNSSVADKAAADIVCDGINDEATINTAFATCRNLRFYDGTYYIDAFTHDANDPRSAVNYYYGIGIPSYAEVGARSSFIGVGKVFGSGAVFDVTAAAIATLPDGTNNVACGIYAKSVGFGLEARNFAVTFPSNQRNHNHGCDFFNAGELVADSIQCLAQKDQGWGQAGTAVAVGGAVDADNIGFVDMDAMSMTSQVSFIKSFCWSIGINFNSDHLHARDCVSWVDTRDYRIGGFGINTIKFPMILDNCWSGKCKYGPLFTSDLVSGHASIYWKYHGEGNGGSYTNFAFVEGASETVAGATTGIINYTIYDVPTVKFWKPGYGRNFQTYDMRRGSIDTQNIQKNIYNKNWADSTGFTFAQSNGTFTNGFTFGNLAITANANAYANIYQPAGYGYYFVPTSEAFLLRFATIINARAASQATSVLWIGLLSAPTTPSNTQNHAAFKVLNGALYASCGNGTNGTQVDLGIAYSQYTQTDLAIDLGPADVKFYVNGLLKATISTYKPVDGEICATAHLLNSASVAVNWYIFPFKIQQGN